MARLLVIVVFFLVSFYFLAKLFQSKIFLYTGEQDVILTTVLLAPNLKIQLYPVDDDKFGKITRSYNLPQESIFVQKGYSITFENEIKQQIVLPKEVKIFDVSMQYVKAELDPFGVSYTLRLISINNEKFWILNSVMERELLLHNDSVTFTPPSKLVSSRFFN